MMKFEDCEEKERRRLYSLEKKKKISNDSATQTDKTSEMDEDEQRR